MKSANIRVTKDEVEALASILKELRRPSMGSGKPLWHRLALHGSTIYTVQQIYDKARNAVASQEESR